MFQFKNEEKVNVQSWITKMMNIVEIHKQLTMEYPRENIEQQRIQTKMHKKLSKILKSPLVLLYKLQL